MAEWQEFSQKRILEVKQRIQTIVVYEELPVKAVDMPAGGIAVQDGDPVQKEAVVDSFDRPLQAQYT